MAVKSTIQNKMAGKVKLSDTVKKAEPTYASAGVKTEEKANSRDDKQTSLTPRPKKVCYFCETKTIPSYTDVVTLRKFMSDRAKIVAKMRTGACSKHQRAITREIKHARHLALMPFVPSI